RNDKVVGNAMYSARYLLENKVGATDKLAEIYSDPAVRPFVGRAVAPAPSPATDVRIEGDQLKWNASGDVQAVVYYFADQEQPGRVLAVTNQTSFSIAAAGLYSVSTINADNQESEPSEPLERK